MLSGNTAALMHVIVIIRGFTYRYGSCQPSWTPKTYI